MRKSRFTEEKIALSKKVFAPARSVTAKMSDLRARLAAILQRLAPDLAAELAKVLFSG